MTQNESMVKERMKKKYRTLLVFVLILTIAGPFFILADFNLGVPVYLSATLILVAIFLGLRKNDSVSRETNEDNDDV